MTDTKLTALRAAMTQAALAAYIQPVHDEYLSEYPPACNRRVEWLTGFSGSAGAVAVTMDKAALFVDGRYTLQARAQAGEALFSHHNSAQLSPAQWLVGELPSGARIGYDEALTSESMLKKMQAALGTSGAVLVPVANLVDAIWQGRPQLPSGPVRLHPLAFSGEEAALKRARIAQEISKAGADVALIEAPDSVCWLLNIRGNDTEHTPLVLAPALIDTAGQVQLFVSPQRVSAEVAAHLGNAVAVVDPRELVPTLTALAQSGKRVLYDADSTPLLHAKLLAQGGAMPVRAADPCQLPKAMKNAVELAGTRSAHQRDGQAIIRLLAWLEREVEKRSVSEIEVEEKLLALRKTNAHFDEPSFSTIAGSGPNGAIVHYRATEKTNRNLQKGELLLLDSGGQYLDGTTDITRTVAIGTPSAEHKDRFTRVLKGHIAIATAQFPEGTNGSQLDALARQYLWQAGLDYDHGTGHGVGCFLGVHEGPQRISKRAGDAPLAPGMILSNEPGYYKTGDYGIRIENLVVVRQAAEKFLTFETITCAPIDTRLVEVSMLTAAEKKWLNGYHAWVLAQQLAGLSAEDAAWLSARCAPI